MLPTSLLIFHNEEKNYKLNIEIKSNIVVKEIAKKIVLSSVRWEMSEIKRSSCSSYYRARTF